MISSVRNLMASVRPLLDSMITMPMGKLSELVADVERSFETPQVGPNHCEGPFMRSHLVGVANALEAVSRGEFHPAVPYDIRPFMTAVALARADLAQLHVLLHDVEKPKTMTIVFQDGTKRAITWEEWAEWTGIPQTEHALAAACQTLIPLNSGLPEVVQISYYQEADGVKVSHGKKAADRLRGYADPLLVGGIETHEVAFLFGDRGGINLPLFHEHFGGWSEGDVVYALVVNYADQMGSLKLDGQPDISDFRWLAKTWRAYVAFQVVKANLDGLRLDQHKATRLMDTLWKSTDAFQKETVDAALARIRAECELRSFSEAQVRSALMPIVGLSPEIADVIVKDMATEGKLSPDTGKQLGGLNKSVRAALAQLA